MSRESRIRVLDSGRIRTILVLSGALLLCSTSAKAAPLPTTPADFEQLGTQPNTLPSELANTDACAGCHGFYDEDVEPYFNWRGSMHAQAGRDVLMIAARSIANQDVNGAGEFCIRCHTPRGWLAGRSSDPTGDALTDDDLEGVTCHLCHRLVNPTYVSGESPAVDQAILDDLDTSGLVPVTPGNAQFVVDPQDRRRGPFDLSSNGAPHMWLESPFHTKSQICATCHDVSNPVLELSGDGSYDIGLLDTPHTTQDKLDMLPEQRTYTEWSLSQFFGSPIDLSGRYGGNSSSYQHCQDCHMVSTNGTGCHPAFQPPFRNDLPMHGFAGANTWIHDARIIEEGPGINPDLEAALLKGKAKNQTMLSRAADVDLTQNDGFLSARVTNQTAHKLPTGYPEGRRMWLNVRFLDSNGMLIEERGEYDLVDADLTTDGTKVYQMRMGLDADMANSTGLPEGESFHLVLNNSVVLDNRVPPRGFRNSRFTLNHIEPVGYSYADLQYWDDTDFAMPPCTTDVEVRLKYQTSSKEYMEFLRDVSTNGEGMDAYNLWVMAGKSAPFTMVTETLPVSDFAAGNSDGDCDVDLRDYADFQLCFGAMPVSPFCSEFDIDVDSDVDRDDLGLLELRLTGPR